MQVLYRYIKIFVHSRLGATCFCLKRPDRFPWTVLTRSREEDRKIAGGTRVTAPPDQVVDNISCSGHITQARKQSRKSFRDTTQPCGRIRTDLVQGLHEATLRAKKVRLLPEAVPESVPSVRVRRAEFYLKSTGVLQSGGFGKGVRGGGDVGR